jgi:hypothetical protein
VDTQAHKCQQLAAFAPYNKVAGCHRLKFFGAENAGFSALTGLGSALSSGFGNASIPRNRESKPQSLRSKSLT